MNCNCGVPAVFFTAKQGDNIGREYAICAALSGVKCNFFHWMDSQAPPKTTSYMSNPAKYVSAAAPFSSSSNNNNNSNNNLNKSRLIVKLSFHSFDIGPPIVAWVAAVHDRDDRLVSYYETIPPDQRQYIENKKLWVFSFDVYNELVKGMRGLDFADVAELPQFVVQGMKRFIDDRRRDRVVVAVDPVLNIQPALYEKLLPFQLAGVKYIVRRGGRGFIGDEMGLGKTIQAIALLQHYRQCWPALVMMPVTLLKQWESELVKFSSDILRPQDVVIVRKEKDVIGNARIVLAPYTMVEKMVECGRLDPERFGVVIADESHNLKNKDAKRTAAALPFLQTAGVAVCLSGTPAINRPAELFTQLSGLLPRVFNDYNAFVMRYCDAKESIFQRGQLDVRGSSNEAELKLLLESLCLIRRLKADTLDSLPQKTREVKYVNADPAHSRDLNALLKKGEELKKKLRLPGLSDEARKHMKMEEEQVMMQLYSLTGVAKITAICSELQLLLNIAHQDRSAAEAVDDGDRCANRAKESAPLFVHGDEDYLLVDDSSRHNGDKFKKEKDSWSLYSVPEVFSLVDDDDDQDKVAPAELPKVSSVKAASAKEVISVDLTDVEVAVEDEEEPVRKRGRVVCPAGAVVPSLEEDDFTAMKAGEEASYDLGPSCSALEATLKAGSASAKREPQQKQALDGDDLLIDSDDDCNAGSGSRRNRLKKRSADKVSSTQRRSKPRADGGRGALRDRRVHAYDDVLEDDCDEEEEWSGDDVLEESSRKRDRAQAAAAASSSSSSSSAAAIGRAWADVEDEWKEVLGSADDNPPYQQQKQKQKQEQSPQDSSSGRSAAYRRSVREQLPDEWKEVLASQDDGDNDDLGDYDEDDEDNLSKIKKAYFSGPSWASGAGKKAPKKKAASAGKKVSSAAAATAYRGLGQKIIVFAHHVSVMDAVQKFLVKSNIMHIRMDGSTSANKRNELVQRFQNDDDTEVALLSISACGVGLNLTRANAALFAELTWSVGMILQAEDRIHRLGQKSAACKIVYLLCRNSCDDMMFDLLQRKHSMIGESVGISGHSSAGMVIDKKTNDKVERPPTLVAATPAASAPLATHPNPTPLSARPNRPSAGSPTKTIDSFFTKVLTSNAPMPALAGQHPSTAAAVALPGLYAAASAHDYGKIVAAVAAPVAPLKAQQQPLSDETRRLIEAKREEAKRKYLVKQQAEAQRTEAQPLQNTFSTARGTTFTARSID